MGAFCGGRGRDIPVDASKEVTELRGEEGTAPPCCLQGKEDQCPQGDPWPPQTREPPELTSTCSHSPWRAQMSAMASSGSKLPRTVVPLVAHTKRGSEPWGGIGRCLDMLGVPGAWKGVEGSGGHRGLKVARMVAQIKKGVHVLGRYLRELWEGLGSDRS